jgi:hypothetical protein
VLLSGPALLLNTCSVISLTGSALHFAKYLVGADSLFIVVSGACRMLLLLFNAVHFYERQFMNGSCTFRSQVGCRLASCRKYSPVAVNVCLCTMRPLVAGGMVHRAAFRICNSCVASSWSGVAIQWEEPCFAAWRSRVEICSGCRLFPCLNNPPPGECCISTVKTACN